MKRIMIIVSLAVLASCSLTEERPETARLIVQAATYQVIDGDASKAERVIEIATEVRSIAETDPHLTIAALVQSARELVRWDTLEPSERLLIEALLVELQYRLEERFGPDPLPADLRLTVDRIAGWVVDAASIAT